VPAWLPLSAAPIADGWLAPLVTGIVLGLGAAVPPGPVNMEIARRTTRGGFLAGASVGLGAVTVDVGFAVLLWLGLLQLVQSSPLIRVPITILGIALLLFLGLSALLNFRRHLRSGSAALVGIDPGDVGPASPKPAAGYVTGLVICLTSPYQAAWWLTGVPAVLANLGGEGVTRRGGALLCAGVFLATFAWTVAFAALLGLVRSLDRRRWLPAAMDLVGGVVLLGFAILSTWNLLSRLL
jgi:threonine/homoserine/homoserine lactone efflux protein